MRIQKVGFIVGAVVGLALVTGCSVGGQPQAATAPSSAATSTETVTVTQQQATTVTATVTVTPSAPDFVPPAGFADWGEGVAAKWSDDSAFNCAESTDSCWGVDLYSQDGCPDGILVVLDVFRDQTKLTVLDSTSPAVAPAGTVSIVVGQTGNGTGLNAKMVDIRCSTA